MINEEGFTSEFRKLAEIRLPEFTGTRVMMMPVVLGDMESIPASLKHYKECIKSLFLLQKHKDEIGYITIDEKFVVAGTSHRRGGKHVDGVYQGTCGGWGGGGGGWGSHGNGMLTVSSHAACQAWRGFFRGWPGVEGECDHLSEQCVLGEVLEPKTVYWVDGMCVHESMPIDKDINRQFIRLSLPSGGPWFEGYTENPLGIKPSAEILPTRVFMEQGDE